ncbi:hypothetical protein FB451DRAFT_1394234 [Mycena latifolia]|nr:hypothetical protein FB451DRAFT_1394234 [Mycena latifolia]
MRELRQEMGGGAFFDVLRARLPLDYNSTRRRRREDDSCSSGRRRTRARALSASRAGALFAGAAASPSAVGEASASAGDPGGEGGQGEGSNGEAEGAEERFWKDSRYAPGYVPLLPVRVYPSDSEDVDVDEDEPTTPPFFRALADTCRAILAAPPPPAPTASASAPSKSDAYNKKKAVSNNGFPRETTPAPRASARLTAHTVASVRAGAARGWTTLTANRTSVRALLREVGVRGAGVGAGEVSAQEKEDAQEDKAALWLVDPRSLAEGARERAEASYAALEAP